jgi:CrcB protein
VTVALAFVAAAMAGALARAEAARRGNRPDGFPWGTLAVNVTGAFLLGLLVDTAPPLVTILGVGGLGAYTTFSGFAADTVGLARQGRPVLAAVYVAASCGAGVPAAAAGISLAPI